MIIKILKSTANKGFHLLAGINRPIMPAHVSNMAASIEMLGIIRPVVVAQIAFITGKSNYYIVDGQHLFHALIRLGLNIPYLTIDVADQEELISAIAKLNSSSKSWTLRDYITAWSSLKKDYVKLNESINTYDFETGITACVLGDQRITYSFKGGATSMMKSIKDGSFVVKKEKEAKNILDYLTDSLSIVGRMDRAQNKYFCIEFIAFYKSNRDRYDHKDFLKCLQENKSKFVTATLKENALVSIFERFIN